MFMGNVFTTNMLTNGYSNISKGIAAFTHRHSFYFHDNLFLLMWIRQKWPKKVHLDGSTWAEWKQNRTKGKLVVAHTMNSLIWFIHIWWRERERARIDEIFYWKPLINFALNGSSVRIVVVHIAKQKCSIHLWVLDVNIDDDKPNSSRVCVCLFCQNHCVYLLRCRRICAQENFIYSIVVYPSIYNTNTHCVCCCCCSCCLSVLVRSPRIHFNVVVRQSMSLCIPAHSICIYMYARLHN